MNVLIRLVVIAIGGAIAMLLGMSRHTKKPAIGGPPLDELRAPMPVWITVVVFAMIPVSTGLGIFYWRFVSEADVFRPEITGEDGATLLVAGVLVAFGAWFAYMGVRFGMVRHKLVTGGIEVQRLFSGRKEKFTWADLTQLEFRGKVFNLRAKDGRKASLSVWLRGLPEFARAARAGVAPTAISLDTARILKETADGRPPNVLAT